MALPRLDLSRVSYAAMGGDAPFDVPLGADMPPPEERGSGSSSDDDGMGAFVEGAADRLAAFHAKLERNELLKRAKAAAAQNANSPEPDVGVTDAVYERLEAERKEVERLVAVEASLREEKRRLAELKQATANAAATAATTNHYYDANQNAHAGDAIEDLRARRAAIAAQIQAATLGASAQNVPPAGPAPKARWKQREEQRWAELEHKASAMAPLPKPRPGWKERRAQRQQHAVAGGAAAPQSAMMGTRQQMLPPQRRTHFAPETASPARRHAGSPTRSVSYAPPPPPAPVHAHSPWRAPAHVPQPVPAPPPPQMVPPPTAYSGVGYHPPSQPPWGAPAPTWMSPSVSYAHAMPMPVPHAHMPTMHTPYGAAHPPPPTAMHHSPYHAPPPPQQHQQMHHHSSHTSPPSDGGGVFALIRAGNRRDEVKMMLRANPSAAHARDANGDTALMVACQLGDQRMARVLLRAGADVNSCNAQGNTPLHYCFGFGHVALGDYLVSKGANDTLENHRGLCCYDMHMPS